jgi:hypothetical protein
MSEAVPTEVPEEPDLSDDDVFIERRDKVFEAIRDDEEQFRKCVAEIYVFICSMEQSVRKAVNNPLFQKFMGGKVG